jgi:hypothetical protein
LLASDWTVRIADFGHSTSPDAPPLARPLRPSHCPSADHRCLAPECYDDNCGRASDVFAFALTLFEIVAGRPAFPGSLRIDKVAFRVVHGERPEIPEWVPPPAQALISDCWAAEPDERPTFEEIVERLAEMEFKVTEDVKSANVAKFVRGIEEWEKQNARE